MVQVLLLFKSGCLQYVHLRHPREPTPAGLLVIRFPGCRAQPPSLCRTGPVKAAKFPIGLTFARDLGPDFRDGLFFIQIEISARKSEVPC